MVTRRDVLGGLAGGAFSLGLPGAARAAELDKGPTLSMRIVKDGKLPREVFVAYPALAVISWETSLEMRFRHGVECLKAQGYEPAGPYFSVDFFKADRSVWGPDWVTPLISSEDVFERGKYSHINRVIRQRMSGKVMGMNIDSTGWLVRAKRPPFEPPVLDDLAVVKVAIHTTG